jgi:Zn-dependent membrane protease YugP
LIPVVNLINYAGYIVLLISIFGSFIQYIEVSIVMILASLVFQLITLPVEFDASRRGKQQLVELGFISEEDREGVEKVLSAAAFTYVAGVLSSLLNLLRLLLLFNNRRRR